MSAYVLLFFLLQPDGTLTTRADTQMHIGADLCLSRQEELRVDLQKLKDKRTIRDFSTLCIDSKIIPGVPA